MDDRSTQPTQVELVKHWLHLVNVGDAETRAKARQDIVNMATALDIFVTLNTVTK